MAAVPAQRLRFLWAQEFHDEDKSNERIAASDPFAVVECLHRDLSGGTTGHDGNITTPEEGFDVILFFSCRALYPRSDDPRSVAQGLRFVAAWELSAGSQQERASMSWSGFSRAMMCSRRPPVPYCQSHLPKAFCLVLVWTHHSELVEWIYSIERDPKESFLAQGSRVPQFAPVFLAASLAFLLQTVMAVIPWWSSGAGYTVEWERSYSYEIGLVYFPWCGSISSRRMRKTPSGTAMDTLEERNQLLLSQNNHFGAENSSRNRLLFYHR